MPSMVDIYIHHIGYICPANSLYMSCNTAKCGDIAVRYYLLEECTQETVVYGIEVECRRRNVPDCAISRLLLDECGPGGGSGSGAVTPVVVRDVVEDWLLA